VNFNAVYAINGWDSSISVINADTNTVAGTITIQGARYPHHISLSPDHSKLAVSVPGMDMSGGHHGGMPGMHGAVLILDALTGRTLVSTFLPQMNHNAAWSPDGTQVWTSQMIKGGSALVLNVADLSTVTSVPAGDSPAEVSFSADGTRVFVTNETSNNVTAVDAASKAVLGNVPVGANPVGAWTGVDGFMYVTAEQGKSVTVIRASDLSVTQTYNLGYTPGMAITSPANDGSLWISNEDQGSIDVNMTSMNMSMATIATGAGAHGIAFSPDGSKVYVTDQAANTVSAIDASSHSVLSTISVGQKPNGIVYRAQ
jgi:YVTN family beta-propeller protein